MEEKEGARQRGRKESEITERASDQREQGEREGKKKGQLERAKVHSAEALVHPVTEAARLPDRQWISR